jgi:hypothetical protein
MALLESLLRATAVAALLNFVVDGDPADEKGGHNTENDEEIAH